ncbi:hypothetical protein ACC680_08210 [Rhizobium ruizarguesonis]
MTSLTQAQIAEFQGIASNAPSLSPSDQHSLLKATANLLVKTICGASRALTTATTPMNISPSSLTSSGCANCPRH